MAVAVRIGVPDTREAGYGAPVVNEEQLKEILASVQAGTLPVDGAISGLRDLPFKSLGFANADVHRKLRTGYAEVVFGPGKTAEQIAEILAELGKHGGTVFASRVQADVASDVLKCLPTAESFSAREPSWLGGVVRFPC
ncbi:MAG: hypothetical protein SGI86_18605 [Deltaproteobacteria bacterium]|nr:hypothetical protein [Deltaproteobacteria bacterium]